MSNGNGNGNGNGSSNGSGNGSGNGTGTGNGYGNGNYDYADGQTKCIERNMTCKCIIIEKPLKQRPAKIQKDNCAEEIKEESAPSAPIKKECDKIACLLGDQIRNCLIAKSKARNSNYTKNGDNDCS